MKIELELDEDFLSCDWDKDEETNTPFYCVNATSFSPYRDRDNYTCYTEEIEKLQADSIEDLYEYMADTFIKHQIYGEQQCRNHDKHLSDLYRVEFSNIFIEVAYYSEERMKSSQAYQNIGAARDAAKEKERKEKEAAEKEAAEKAAREWREKDKERRDREEYERLNKKYGK